MKNICFVVLTFESKIWTIEFCAWLPFQISGKITYQSAARDTDNSKDIILQRGHLMSGKAIIQYALVEHCESGKRRLLIQGDRARYISDIAWASGVNTLQQRLLKYYS